jgi:multidrug resistance efflux pump
VLAAEGDSVKEGQVLVELDPFDLRELCAQAAAQLASRTADHAKLKAGFRIEEIAQAKAKADELAARLEELRNGPRVEVSSTDRNVRFLRRIGMSAFGEAF